MNSTENTINSNDFDYVDLGLPSGTLWATCNVGASKPSDYGFYFQWGDTKGYAFEQVGKEKQFNWSDYKWNLTGDEKIFTKYNIDGATLELEDDAAHVNMGGDWHMPSTKQTRELLDNTITTWIASDGVNGMKFTSKKDTSKFIFIPIPGYAWDGLVFDSGSFGLIWLSMLMDKGISYAKYLAFYPDGAYIGNGGRDGGFSVRGVIG